MELMRAAVGGRTSLTKIKMAFSGASLIRFLITYTNWPTVRSCRLPCVSHIHENLRPPTYRWHQVFLLVDCWDVCLVRLLTNHLPPRNQSISVTTIPDEQTYWDTIRVLLTNPLGLSLSLLYDAVATIQVSSIHAKTACETHRRGARP